jgi:peptidoglycan/xylan/chitin deacetylase (PgdA/CDA1 family)
MNRTIKILGFVFIALGFVVSSCKEEKSNVAAPPAVAKVEPVVPPKPMKLPAEKAPSNAKFIYLTFDDGPLPGSEAINRLTQEQKFKASVFIVGKHTGNNRNSMRVFQDYVRNPYVDVCNHSFTHANNAYDKFYQHPDEAASDIFKNQEDLNLDLRIVRFPGRQLWMLPKRDLNMKVSSAAKTAELLKPDSFRIIGWDVEWAPKGLGTKETPEEMMAKIDKLFAQDMTFTRNHLVVLTHDVMFQKQAGQDALVKLVGLLREKGYILENIRQYPDNEIADAY